MNESIKITDQKEVPINIKWISMDIEPSEDIDRVILYEKGNLLSTDWYEYRYRTGDNKWAQTGCPSCNEEQTEWKDLQKKYHFNLYLPVPSFYEKYREREDWDASYRDC